MPSSKRTSVIKGREGAWALLERVSQLLYNREWLKGSRAQLSDGRNVHPHHYKAKAFDLYGAYLRAGKNKTESDRLYAHEALRKAILPAQSLTEFNDAEYRTLREVQSAIYRAKQSLLT